MVVIRSPLLDLQFVPIFKLFADGTERAFDIITQQGFSILYGQHEMLVSTAEAVAASFEHGDIVP